eukprot:scaffold10855_cov63-Phaeocystis_antarctica.AAC.1
MSAFRSARYPVSSAISRAMIAPTESSALDGSLAIFRSVDTLALPKPHANTVTFCPLTSFAASTAVCNSVLPVALSIVCSPSERSSTTLAAFSRGSRGSSKRRHTSSKPSEIE